MTEQTKSLMGTNAYSNSRYDQEAKEHEDLLKSRALAAGQPDVNADTSTEQTPEHDWEKRYKDLQSYNSKQTNALKAEITTLKNTQTPAFVVPKTAEELAAYRADKPQEYAFIESIAHTIAKDLTKGVQAELENVSGDLQQNRIEKAALAIEAAHPDWATLRESQDFHTWGSKQDEVVQGWLYDNPDNAENAIRAINLYKADLNLQGQTLNQGNVQNQNLAAQAVNVQGNQGLPNETDRNHPAYVWKDSEIAAMGTGDFAKWQEHIQLAYREGRYAQNA